MESDFDGATQLLLDLFLNLQLLEFVQFSGLKEGAEVDTGRLQLLLDCGQRFALGANLGLFLQVLIEMKTWYLNYNKTGK
jgi:hypothetical protein